jgi:uncharacterized membrane protein YfcA
MQFEIDSGILLLAAVPVVGFIAGFINTLAGSGSLITLPVLILLGLPANVANGTNRVGILVQNLVSVATFRQQQALEFGGSARLVVPSVLGALVGAMLAVDLDEALMNRTIGVLMLLMLGIMLIRPNRWLAAHASGSSLPTLWQLPIYFVLGIYCGFIQAGAGIFLLAGLVLASGYDLVRGNAMKNLIVLIVTVAALAVFVINDQVRWGLGLLLASGQAAGAWVAARMAVSRGAGFVRWFLIGVILLSAIALFGDFRLVS